MEDKIVITKNPSHFGIKYLEKHKNGLRTTYTSNDYMLKSFKDLVSQLEEDSWKTNTNTLCKGSYCNYDPYDDYDGKYHTFIIDDYDNKVTIIENDIIKSPCEINGINDLLLFRYTNDSEKTDFHYNTIIKTNFAQTIGTALLFPPADISPFTGGELVFRLDEDDLEMIYTIQPSTFTEWMLITFDDLQYKFNPVTNGTMYVFKSNIFTKNIDD
jgi:hypothetical protein